MEALATPQQPRGSGAPLAPSRLAAWLGASLAVVLLLGLGSLLPGWWSAPQRPAAQAPALPSPPVAAPSQPLVPAAVPSAAASRSTVGRATPATLHSRTPAPPRSKSDSPAREATALNAEALQQAYAALLAGQFEQAQGLYAQVLSLHPQERDALLGLAYIAHRTGHLQEALDGYQRVLRQDPDHPTAHAGMLALNASVDLEQAARRARAMAERHPESGASLAALGAVLVRQGRLGESAQAFARAQALEPQQAQHAYNLALALDHLHQYGQAQLAYAQALTLCTDCAGANGFSRAAVEQRLAQLRAANNAGRP